MRPRGWLLVVAFALCATGAVPIERMDDPEQVVVARDGSVELSVAESNGELCLDILDARTLGGSGSGCGDPRAGIATPPLSTDEGLLYVGVAVAPEVASVEVRRLGKVVGSAPTVAGEDPRGAAAGPLRFALVRIAAGTRGGGLRVHARDATGALVAVLDSGGERFIERRRLLSGRAGRVSWSLREERHSILDSALFDLARETVERCVTIRINVPAGGSIDSYGSGLASCTTGTPAEELILDADFLQARAQDRCAPSFRLMHGTLPGSVTRVTVVLGDGRRVRAPIAALRGNARRVWALVVGAGDAVRSVTLDRAGATSGTLSLRVAPVAIGCAIRASNSLFTLFFFGFGDGLPAVPTGPATALAGPPAFRVADGPAGTLCLALGEEPFTAAGCAVVGPSFSRLHSVMDNDFDPSVAVLAVPARVAVVRFSSLDGRTAVTVPTIAAEGYGGRYAGLVRFAATRLARFYDLPRLELHDAAGKLLYRADEDRVTPAQVRRRVLSTRRVAGAVGAPSLWQTRMTLGGEAERCLAVTAGPPPPPEERCEARRAPESLLLDASCATHRLTVAVAVRPGTRVLAGLGTGEQRRVRLRDGAGLLTLRPRAGLRSLTFVRSGRPRRVQIDAPAGARQCGWSAAPDIEAR